MWDIYYCSVDMQTVYLHLIHKILWWIKRLKYDILTKLNSVICRKGSLITSNDNTKEDEQLFEMV